ncbi:MAG: S8 family serine peptidase [Vulcanimicrobiota bacterium]
MPGPVGKPEFFSFNQLNSIQEAFEGKKPAKASAEQPQVLSDSVSLGKQEKTQNVIIVPGKGLMKSKAKVDTDTMAKELSKKGVEVDSKLDVISGVTAKIKPEDAEKLKEQGFVIFDDSERQLIPDMPKVLNATPGAKPWDMPKIEDVKWTQAGDLHKQGITGKGQVVAVIDSGYNHPEKKLVAWKDVVDGSPEPVDPNGHGTHVAGDVIKTAPEANIIGIRVMGGNGTGKTSDIVKGIQWAIDNKEKHNIDTINMSLGGPPDGWPHYFSPINTAVEKAVEKGITVVAAAGNSGPNAHTIGAPADSPHALSVGSALNPEKVSDFSSRGPTDDKLVKPDIMAPGEYITSWAVPGSQMDKIATTVETHRRMTPAQLRKLFVAKPDLMKALGLPEDLLQKDDAGLEKTTKTSLPPMYKPTPDTIAGPGTSFASPEVAGIVAGLKQAHPKATPQEIKDALMKTAKNMGAHYSNMDQGAGFVQADKARKSMG